MSAQRGQGPAERAARAFGRGTRWAGRQARGEVVKRVGGPARARNYSVAEITAVVNKSLKAVLVLHE